MELYAAAAGVVIVIASLALCCMRRRRIMARREQAEELPQFVPIMPGLAPNAAPLSEKEAAQRAFAMRARDFGTGAWGTGQPVAESTSGATSLRTYDPVQAFHEEPVAETRISLPGMASAESPVAEPRRIVQRFGDIAIESFAC